MSIMAAPSIRPIRNCLYGRHIGCTRRHSYQPVSRALVGTGGLFFFVVFFFCLFVFFVVFFLLLLLLFFHLIFPIFLF